MVTKEQARKRAEIVASDQGRIILYAVIMIDEYIAKWFSWKGIR